MASQPNDATTQSNQRTHAFISYSRKDQRYLEELRSQLEQYVSFGLINYWDDTKIRPGMRWRDEIDKALQSARVAILLVSADFLSSKFILDYELPPLLEAEKKGETKLLSVIVRPCAFKYSELKNIQTINDPSRPLSGMSQAQREEVWAKLAEEVKRYLQDE